jgi:hypothetical protein
MLYIQIWIGLDYFKAKYMVHRINQHIPSNNLEPFSSPFVNFSVSKKN